MMSRFFYKTALYTSLFLAFSTLASCAFQSSEDTAMDNTPVTIQLGESLESFQARYSNRARITYQPAGVNFVKINWPAEARGLVHFEHGIHSFDIPHVRGASSGEDEGELKNEGLNWFLINAGTGFDGPTPHIEAQKAFYALLKRIQDAGWQRYIPFYAPRIRGKARYNYLIAHHEGGLDAEYMPPIDEWRKLRNKLYRFYVDGIFLSVKFNCWESEDEPEVSGTYLFSFDFETDTSYFRSITEFEEGTDWKKNFRAQIEESLSERKEREAELRAQGIEIDEAYQDPPFPEGI